MRCLAISLICLLLAACAVVVLSNDQIPVGHWVYEALNNLAEAGYLPGYPGAWVSAGHPLTRHECAFYVREAILRLKKDEAEPDDPPMPSQVETSLGRLVSEFSHELKAFGVNVEPWVENPDRVVFIDLDNLVAAIGHRPEAPPAAVPPPASDGAAGPGQDLSLLDGTYQTISFEALQLPLSDFRTTPNGLFGLAGEVLGAEWTLDLAGSQPYEDLFGLPIRIGGFMISSEQTTLQTSGLGFRIGDEFGLGFDALLFLDLDQAQIAMNLLLVDVTTQYDLNERLGLFGGLSLEYRPNISSEFELSSAAIAGLRVLIWDDLYLIAEYSLANPFSEELPHRQGPSLGLSLGEIGLFLLGMQTTSLADFEDLEMTGTFIYRF